MPLFSATCAATRRTGHPGASEHLEEGSRLRLRLAASGGRLFDEGWCEWTYVCSHYRASGSRIFNFVPRPFPFKTRALVRAVVMELIE